MGTPEFAVPSFAALLEAGYAVAAAVTAPDKPRGRGQKTAPTPVKTLAEFRGIPVLEPAALRAPEFAQELRTLRADLYVVVAFRILPPPVFTIPPLGAINLHASLLPKYRGAAPINWALINGDSETGVTTFFLREAVDTGAMLLQERVPIHPQDDAGALHDRLALVGAALVLRTVRAIEQGGAVPLPQDDTLATPAPKIFREDCRLRWERPAWELVNRVRGLSPVPGAFTLHEGRTLKVYRAAALPGVQGAAPGAVLPGEGRILVGTGSGCLELLELQLEGRKRMGAAEFLRGYPLEPGALLA
jgi:methionyl-tRNA formyltransferase